MTSLLTHGMNAPNQQEGKKKPVILADSGQ